MKLVLAALVLIVIALAGSGRVAFGWRLPVGARLVFITGTEYIFVGLLLGQRYLNVIDSDSLVGLEPLVLVALGWVGLLFGLQFDRRSLKNLPLQFFTVSVLQGLVTTVTVFAVFWVVFLAMFGSHSGTELALAAAALAAAAACTGQPGLAILHEQVTASNRHLVSLLRYIASVDPLVGIVALGLATSLLLDSGPVGLPPGLSLIVGLGVGCLMGWVISSLAVGRVTQPELLVLILGSVAICGGLAVRFGASTLLISTICGAVVANFSRLRVRMEELLAGGEKLIYVVLLILAGARWSLPTTWVVLLALAYLMVRIVAKVAGVFLATRTLARHLLMPHYLGLGLTAQAGMALAIVIDFHYLAPGSLSDTVLSVAVLGIMFSELIGPSVALKVIRAASADPQSQNLLNGAGPV